MSDDHRTQVVEQKDGRFEPSCSCGWFGDWEEKEAKAVEEAEAHEWFIAHWDDSE